MTRSVPEKLLIPYIADPFLQDNQAIGSLLKKSGSLVSIDKINWPDYFYDPGVRLWTAYSERYLWLCYETGKDFFRAKALADQEAVWEDSCVEFFMSTDDVLIGGPSGRENAVYRNFEFNALGYCLSAFGDNKQREPIASSELVRIHRIPSVTSQNKPEEGTEFNWELTVAIPLDLLGIKPGATFRVNFYKCGDLTKEPHFLSWRSIISDSPDFHLPQFFGEAELVV